MSPEPARDRLRRVADRLPDGLRRRAEVTARRVRSGGPEVSVVVLLHGHEAHARAALDAVRDQPLPRLEIVAVVMQDHLHDLAETASIADYIYVVGEGKVLGQGTPQELMNSQEPRIRQFMTGEPDGLADLDDPVERPTDRSPSRRRSAPRTRRSRR